MDRPVKPMNPLMRMAVLAGVETAVRLHIRRGDNLDARDGGGATPLMLAAGRKKKGVVALLLSAGDNIGASLFNSSAMLFTIDFFSHDSVAS